MADERLRDVLRVFEAAMERAGAERAAYLDAECGADTALRHEVAALLVEPSEEQLPPLELSLRASPAVAVGQRLGPYVIVAPIGAGGMGEVYKARDTRLGRTVAIKVLPVAAAADAGRHRRFELEARAASALNHPHICALYDIGSERPVPPAGSEGSATDDPVPFLVMEYLDGQTLAERLCQGPLPLAQAVDLGAQIADALATAHRHGIVHRDLKPANIMLTRAGAVRRDSPQAKLLDFGLAKLRPQQSTAGVVTSGLGAQGSTTSPRVVLGTVPYMAPEQLEGKEVDARADIFAFGAVLHEMLTGQRAFAGASEARVISAILTSAPPAVSDLQPMTPRALDRLVRRCLAKNRDDRWQDAADVAEELRGIAADSVASPSSSAPRRPTLRGWWLAACAALVVAGVLLVSFGLRLHWPANPATRGGPAHAAPSWTAARQVTSGPGWETDPEISGDGSLLAYASDESGNSDIWVVPAGGGSAVNVTNNPAVDEKPAWFPDHSALAFASDRSGRWDIWQVPPLGGGPLLLVPDARDPALSPDGRQIAFVRKDALGNPRVVVAPLRDLSRAHGLSALAAYSSEPEEDPAWSPDGRFVCYSAYRGLWVAAAAGGPPRRLTVDREWDSEPTWSPDGQTIYFSSSRGGTDALWKVPAAGGLPERVTSGAGTERHPTLSSNGTRLAFSNFREDFDLVLHDLETGAEQSTGSTRDEVCPVFSPDTRALLYALQSKPGGGAELWLQRLVQHRFAGAPSRLIEEPGALTLPSISRDGRWVAYQRSVNGRSEIVAIPVAGGAPSLVAGATADAVDPAWSPAGDAVAFASGRESNYHIWVVPVAEGRPVGTPRQVTSGRDDQQCPAWSPDSTQVAYVAPWLGVSEVWVTPSDGRGVARRVTAGAAATWVRWRPRGAGIVASGSWGERTISLRLLDPDTHAVTPFKPPVDLGEAAIATQFDISLDGRFVTFARAKRTGDIWVIDLAR